MSISPISANILIFMRCARSWGFRRCGARTGAAPWSPSRPAPRRAALGKRAEQRDLLPHVHGVGGDGIEVRRRRADERLVAIEARVESPASPASAEARGVSMNTVGDGTPATASKTPIGCAAEPVQRRDRGVLQEVGEPARLRPVAHDELAPHVKLRRDRLGGASLAVGSYRDPRRHGRGTRADDRAQELSSFHVRPFLRVQPRS